MANAYQLYTKKKNNKDADTKVADCIAKNMVDAKMQFEKQGFGGAYFLGSYSLPSLIPVVLKKV